MGGNWSPVITIDKLILSLWILIDNPNLDSPANNEAAILY